MFIRSSSEFLQFRNHSFPDPDRMDNLLKAHIWLIVVPGRKPAGS